MKKFNLAAGRGAQTLRTWFRCLLIAPVLLMGSLGAHAAGQSPAPRVSVDVRNASIAQVFQTIQQQTDYSFVYNSADIDAAKPVTLSAAEETLPSVLDRLFAGTGVTYTLKDNHIVLSKTGAKAAPKPVGGVSQAPSRTIRASP